MGRCPHCDRTVEAVEGNYIKESALFNGEVDATSGVQQVQLHCPHCASVLGYLGVGASVGASK
jgi:phage FluMu protein Com